MVNPLTCEACGDRFTSRSDARYCSSACRQKAHRLRSAQRIAELRRRSPLRTSTRRTLVRPNIAISIERARDQRRRSQQLCRAARDLVEAGNEKKLSAPLVREPIATGVASSGAGRRHDVVSPICRECG